MTIAIIEHEHSCDLLGCVECAIWLVLSNTYHFLTDVSLQSARKPCEGVTGKPHDAVVKFGITDRNLQRHRAVLPAIAQLSCLKSIGCLQSCCLLVCVMQWTPASESFDRRFAIINWRMIDDMYLLDEFVQAPARELHQTEPSAAVKRYLKKEEEYCFEKLANKKSGNSGGLPPCPCISPDLSACFVLCLLNSSVL